VSNFTQIRRFIVAGHTDGGSAEDLDPPYKFEIRPIPFFEFKEFLVLNLGRRPLI
jgi:hypothetical protein